MDKNPETKRTRDRDRVRHLTAAAKTQPDDLKKLIALVATQEKIIAAANKELAARRAMDEQQAALRRVVHEVEVPTWLIQPGAGNAGTGVPSLLLSDWHTGEVVDPKRVRGKNVYNKEVQRERVRTLVKGVLDLCFHHMTNPKYPGIVVPVNGDMVSGNIHDELIVTNWGDIRDVLKEAAELIAYVLHNLSDRFEHVYVPWTTGNHGRMTRKMEAKRRVGTSFDSILGDMVQEKMMQYNNVRVDVAEGAVMVYKIYGHRYLLAHGAPASTGAKGGDGIIGAAGPIIRGLVKLLAQAQSLGGEFDTAVFGHFHQRFLLQDVIVNDSLKGFDEFAANSGYRYAPPGQNLWFTHPERGPTCYWPVRVDPKGKRYEGKWLSVWED